MAVEAGPRGQAVVVVATACFLCRGHVPGSFRPKAHGTNDVPWFLRHPPKEKKPCNVRENLPARSHLWRSGPFRGRGPADYGGLLGPRAAACCVLYTMSRLI